MLASLILLSSLSAWSAPPEVSTMHIYKGVAPFVIIQLVGLALLALVPGLPTWLPKVIFG